MTESKRLLIVPELMHLWKFENIYLAGQPVDTSFKNIKELGVTKIINIRGAGEIDAEAEMKIVHECGMEYVHVPLLCPDKNIISDSCMKISEMIDSKGINFVHCATANRVAAWLITYLVQYKKMDFESAVKIAEQSGLCSAGFIIQAEEILGL